MKKLILVALLIFSGMLSAQARLTIENKSTREMVVKVMIDEGKGRLYKTTKIKPYANETIYFHKTGNYFCKTKATLLGKDPIYRKGKSFRVVNDHTGYTEMKLTFSIVESKFPQVTGGETISKAEFEKD